MESKNQLSEDELTRKLIQKAGFVEPSADFTTRVMQSIHSSVKNEVFIYKPIIGLKSWFWIGLSASLTSLFFTYFAESSVVIQPSKLTPYFSLFKYFYGKASFLESINSFNFYPSQVLICAIAAAWLLYVIEKILRKQYSA
jgi:hypothetical protein